MKRLFSLKTKYILASQSPRREELLRLLDISYRIIPSHIDEIIQDGLSFEDVVMDIAKQKAQHVAKDHPENTVLGFDTLVILNGEALGKPVDEADAYNMLEALQGTTHTVLTGCAIVHDNDVTTLYDQADVTFYPMTPIEIEEYLATGEPFDKAGAYGIQGYGAKYIKKVDGDYYSVMGVPLAKLYHALRG